MAKLTAKSGIITNGGKGSQQWGDGVTISAFDLDGKPGSVAYDTQFADHGFGVAGGRWNQIDFYKEGGNRSERLEIDFGGLVNDVVLTVGMLGQREGRPHHETGKWTAYDSNGKKVASGLIGPELSDLGSEKKVKNSYGTFPISLKSNQAFAKVVIEATGFGHGVGQPRQARYGENNSDFNVVAIEYDRGPTSSSPPVPKQNSKPDAVNDNGFSTSENKASKLSTSDLLANDSDADGDSLEITRVSGAVNGSAELQGNSVLFTPKRGFTGNAGFNYVVSDGQGGTDTARVSIEVNPLPAPAPKQNSKPDAVDDNGFSTSENKAFKLLTADLLANDSDADGDSLEITRVSGAVNGSVKLQGNGVLFTPKRGFTGNARFNYVVSDGQGGTDTARVSIEVDSPPTDTSDSDASNTLETEVLRLKVSKDSAKNGILGSGVTIFGLSTDGQEASLVYKRGKLGVKGNRYDYQLDYDPLTGRSEGIVIDFNSDVSNAAIDLGFMSTSEWKGLDETGHWSAFNDGRKVASGKLDPQKSQALGRSTFRFGVGDGIEFDRLLIEATSYGNGVGTDRLDNNSDFGLQAIEFERVI